MTLIFYDSVENEQSFTTTTWTQVESKTGHLNTTENLIRLRFKSDVRETRANRQPITGRALGWLVTSLRLEGRL